MDALTSRFKARVRVGVQIRARAWARVGLSLLIAECVDRREPNPGMGKGRPLIDRLKTRSLSLAVPSAEAEAEA